VDSDWEESPGLFECNDRAGSHPKMFSACLERVSPCGWRLVVRVSVVLGFSEGCPPPRQVIPFL
jgi:hypothetical protein